MEYKTGTLVRARGRDWVVLPSEMPDLLRLKPLGGRDEDVAGIYLPLTSPGDVAVSQFEKPSTKDLGSIRAARLLYDASRLSLRSAAGPFRSAAKLGFRPRSYQMVPLIMALRQHEHIRLLIADDVGVGKTVEAILVVKELLERREISRFAVLCPPHLCEQWQLELKDKFQLDAVIIRTNTQAGLDRKIQGDTSVFRFYPYQIISIDFIKSDQRYLQFVSEAPELVIVDEAHTCAQPEGAHHGQQLRHRLIRELSKKAGQHLVLLTATPHSGKEAEFRSLLGLIKPEFATGEWEGDGRKAFQEQLAKHFIQRRRGDIATWMDEKTPFPTRRIIDLSYKLKVEYQAFYDEVLLFCSDLMRQDQGNSRQQRFRYWSALALLRGIMSSPDAGAQMLENRAKRGLVIQDDEPEGENPHFEQTETTDDELPTPVLEQTDWKTTERQAFQRLSQIASQLDGKKDAKIEACLTQIKAWQRDATKPYSPVIFCRYIQTAHYVAKELEKALGQKTLVECVTSEDPDEVRRDRVAAMERSAREGRHRILVATDCLSEGINLQQLFDAVLHYDLPWNPNRLEQREGRVDRFGQTRQEVQTCLLFGQDNPMDQAVLKILYRKAKNIRDRIGVSIPFPEDSKVFLDTVFQAILADAEKKRRSQTQMELFGMDEMVRSEEALDLMLKTREKKEEAIRGIFAHHNIKAQDIEADLQVTDAAVGRPEHVFRFVRSALQELYGVALPQVDLDKLELDLSLSAAPAELKDYLPQEAKSDAFRLSFQSPVAEGRRYLGRNHDAVEYLCQTVLAEALRDDKGHPSSARAAVVASKAVTERVALYVLRARNVIEDLRSHTHLVAEEVLLYGVRGPERIPLESAEINALMDAPQVAADVPILLQQRQLDRELAMIETIRPQLDALAQSRAEELIKQHERYYKALGSATRTSHFRVVEPVIPLDILGVYIFVPGAEA